MNDMASVTATIESRVTAATLGHVHPDIVAIEAKVLALIARHRFQK